MGIKNNSLGDICDKNIKNWVKSTEGKKVPLWIRIIGSVICINYLLMLVINNNGGRNCIF